MRYKYTEEDVEFLREYYPTGQWDKIFERFPGLTKTCIHSKCSKLGIKLDIQYRQRTEKGRKRWDDSEIELLKSIYTDYPIDYVMSKFPDRTLASVQLKATDLKLLSYNHVNARWKDWEIQYIKDNWELTPDIIMCEHIKRSFRATKAKREELGLFRRDMESFSYPTISKYLRGQNQEWKNNSMKSCDYKCVLTGSKDFQIHHLYGVSNIINDIFNKYPQYRDKPFEDYSEDDLSFILSEFIKEQDKYPLGECVSKNIHVLFHSLYGQYYNTPEQWYTFKDDYKKGKYNDMLNR